MCTFDFGPLVVHEFFEALFDWSIKIISFNWSIKYFQIIVTLNKSHSLSYRKLLISFN